MTILERFILVKICLPDELRPHRGATLGARRRDRQVVDPDRGPHRDACLVTLAREADHAHRGGESAEPTVTDSAESLRTSGLEIYGVGKGMAGEPMADWNSGSTILPRSLERRSPGRNPLWPAPQPRTAGLSLVRRLGGRLGLVGV